MPLATGGFARLVEQDEVGCVDVRLVGEGSMQLYYRYNTDNVMRESMCAWSLRDLCNPWDFANIAENYIAGRCGLGRRGIYATCGSDVVNALIVCRDGLGRRGIYATYVC